jgi:rhamnosyltransferase
LKPKVSIIIPAKNGADYLKDCLEMVFRQKAAFAFDIIIVDSGSTDKTLEIIKKFKNIEQHPELLITMQLQLQQNGKELPQIRLFQIPPLEFGHGKTRNLAASKTHSEYLVFLTQDAIPADENWLAKIIEPMEKDEEVAGVFGKHLPKKNCDPFQRRMLGDFMDLFGKEIKTWKLEEPGDKDEFEKRKHELSFFSNVNSAIRRSAWEKIPFPEVEMGEDQFWAKKILLAGYKKAYAPEAKVYHSHNFGIWNQFKRWFDEYRQHKKNINYVGVSSFWKIPLLTLRLWFNDVKYIESRKEYHFWQKIYWIIWIFFMDLAHFCAEYLGGRYEKLPRWMQRKFSMQWEIIHKKSK